MDLKVVRTNIYEQNKDNLSSILSILMQMLSV